PMDSDRGPRSPTHQDAFGLIGMSSSLHLSGFFEKEHDQTLDNSNYIADVEMLFVAFSDGRIQSTKYYNFKSDPFLNAKSRNDTH
ncbi:CBL-interacting serine/threonine-protein kinase 1-like protein, partial [Tanacetum coccineum]